MSLPTHLASDLPQYLRTLIIRRTLHTNLNYRWNNPVLNLVDFRNSCWKPWMEIKMKYGTAASVYLVPPGFHWKYVHYLVLHTCCTSLKTNESTLKVKGQNMTLCYPFLCPILLPKVTFHTVYLTPHNA